jgi:biopolymer transport protein ExbD
MRQNKFNDIPKINVIPVLDAVFIFIFFLLMSAQFLDFYEVGTMKPEIEAGESVDKNKSKNLKVKLLPNQILVTVNPSEDVLQRFTWDERSLVNLKAFMQGLKQKYPKENSIIIKPQDSIKYEKIIRITDLVQQYVPAKKSKKKVKLFRTLAFENMD